MDPNHTTLRSQTPPIVTSSSSSSSSPSADTNFPILAISILGILTTVILLVSYYVFVIKCCMSWRRGSVLRRLTAVSSRRQSSEPLAFFTFVAERHGLDESTIQSIPAIRFRKQDGRPFYECAVCLNEFQEEEKLRLLPSCSHAFHVDCIDTWLQSSANCPLCRSHIASSSVSIPTLLLASGGTAPDDNQSSGSVVIEVREESSDQNPIREPSPRPRELRSGSKKGRKVRHGSSMGDECIDVRGEDERFSAIQPIRRSFSVDSSSDRQLYLSVQEILQRSNQPSAQPQEGGESGEGCSSGGGAKIRRSFFSFGHGRSSRSAVLPVQIEL